MTRGKLTKTVVLGAIVVVAVVGYVVGKARAHGIPEANTLAYTGVLEDSNGQPVDTSVAMTFQLFDAESAGTMLCQTPTAQVQVSHGRFAIELPKACVDTVKQKQDAWTQLTVGTDVLPRSKLRAVPYAIEAGSASRVIVTNGSKAISASGVYCGTSSTKMTGNMSGLAGAKTICETTCSDPTAHMCTFDEAQRTWALGIVPPNSNAWMSVGPGGLVSGTTVNSDCNNWKSGEATAAGSTLWGDTWYSEKCNATLPIACCK